RKRTASHPCSSASDWDSAGCNVNLVMSRIFGIDLGTTHSLIAVMEGESPRIIPDSSGNPLLPSVVALETDGWTLVGTGAVEMEPHLGAIEDGQVSATRLSDGKDGVVVRSVKRYMGLGGEEIAPEDRRRYAFADLEGPVVRFLVGSRSF